MRDEIFCIAILKKTNDFQQKTSNTLRNSMKSASSGRKTYDFLKKIKDFYQKPEITLRIPPLLFQICRKQGEFLLTLFWTPKFSPAAR